MTDLEKARKILDDAEWEPYHVAASIYTPANEDAALTIAAALKAEREQEREACLKISQDCAATPGQGMGFITITAMKLADLIRARGEP